MFVLFGDNIAVESLAMPLELLNLSVNKAEPCGIN